MELLVPQPTRGARDADCCNWDAVSVENRGGNAGNTVLAFFIIKGVALDSNGLQFSLQNLTIIDCMVSKAAKNCVGEYFFDPLFRKMCYHGFTAASAIEGHASSHLREHLQ